MDADTEKEANPPLVDILDGNFYVEHILARSLESDGIPDDIEGFDEYKDRLGNLTIANGYWNQHYSDLPFDAKKQADSQREAAYATSDLRVQRILADIVDCSGQRLERRHQDIVEFALKEWSFDELNTDL